MSAAESLSEAQRPNLLGLDRQALGDFLRQWGESSFRAGQLLQWLHTRQETDFAAMSNIGKKLQARLAAETSVAEPAIIADQIAADGTRKWLLGLDDGNAIETVFIPDERPRLRKAHTCYGPCRSQSHGHPCNAATERP